jgi:N-(2-amino-2-carboxyethyl)-L-glutamate synthase
MPATGILSAVGGTPLIELGRIAGADFRVHAKLEGLNPGGSIKDRTALSMLCDRISSGELAAGRSTVVESSSGNLAIGLAQVCAYYGLKFVCVVDAKTTGHNLAILRAFGVSVELVTTPDPATGEYLPARLRRVRELLASIPDSYWPNQYANPRNPAAHEDTMREILDALDGRVDYLFCATSSYGTLRGCAEHLEKQDVATTVVGVDAIGSVIFGESAGKPVHRLIPGHGASIRPALYAPGTADLVVHVSDLDCVVGCRLLLGREAILAGGSSGANVAALLRIRDRIPAGANCVLILADRGERYLDTIYSDEWVRGHFGEVSHLWKESHR